MVSRAVKYRRISFECVYFKRFVLMGILIVYFRFLKNYTLMMFEACLINVIKIKLLSEAMDNFLVAAW